MARAGFPGHKGGRLENPPPERFLGRPDPQVDIHRLLERIPRRRRSDRAPASARMICRCPARPAVRMPGILQVGERSKLVRAEMIVDGITQEAGVRQVEQTGLRNPETLPVILNVMIFQPEWT